MFIQGMYTFLICLQLRKDLNARQVWSIFVFILSAWNHKIIKTHASHKIIKREVVKYMS